MFVDVNNDKIAIIIIILIKLIRKFNILSQIYIKYCSNVLLCSHEIPGSAVCAFDLSTIREIFEQGQFKAQQSGSWYAVPPDDVPSPRPGRVSIISVHQHHNICRVLSILNKSRLGKSCEIDFV